jgi:hypothetical protein
MIFLASQTACQLDQGPGIVTGLCGQLPAVLLDSLGGTQDADACFFRSVR